MVHSVFSFQSYLGGRSTFKLRRAGNTKLQADFGGNQFPFDFTMVKWSFENKSTLIKLCTWSAWKHARWCLSQEHSCGGVSFLITDSAVKRQACCSDDKRCSLHLSAESKMTEVLVELAVTLSTIQIRPRSSIRCPSATCC